MFNTIAIALLPVVLIMLLGLHAGKKEYFKPSDVNVLATLVMRYALPCSLFIGALNTPAQKVDNVPFILCMLFGFVVTYVLALAVGRFYYRSDLKASAIAALVCTFPDMAYFGAPILQQVVGPQGFIAVLVGNLITSLIILPLTIVLCRWGEISSTKDQQSISFVLWQSMVRTVSNPIVWLPVLGVTLSFMHVSIPAPLKEVVDMLGKAAGGVSLLALGLMFCGTKMTLDAHVVGNVAIKNFLQPVVMLVGVLLFRLDGDFARQALIVGAVPSAIAASMFAVRYQTYASQASRSVLVSTVVGVFVQALLIYIIG